jgi:hypothetical protein
MNTTRRHHHIDSLPNNRPEIRLFPVGVALLGFRNHKVVLSIANSPADNMIQSFLRIWHIPTLTPIISRIKLDFVAVVLFVNKRRNKVSDLPEFMDG